jgi:hypothetical protein
MVTEMTSKVPLIAIVVLPKYALPHPLTGSCSGGDSHGTISVDSSGNADLRELRRLVPDEAGPAHPAVQELCSYMYAAGLTYGLLCSDVEFWFVRMSADGACVDISRPLKVRHSAALGLQHCCADTSADCAVAVACVSVAARLAWSHRHHRPHLPHAPGPVADGGFGFKLLQLLY